MDPSQTNTGAVASLDSNHYYDRGLTLLAKGRLHEAAAHFEHALMRDPGFALAHNGFGIVLRRQGHLDEAAAHFERSVELNSRLALPHNNLGWLRMAQGLLDEAVIHFQRALVITPDYVEAHIGLGEVRLAQRRLNAAANHFKRAIAIDPNRPAAHYGLGYVLRVRDELQAAAAAFQRAIVLRPDASPAIAQLVYLLHSTCQWEQLQEWAPKLDTLTAKELKEGRMPGQGPMGSLRYCRDPSRHLDIARAWSREVSQRASRCGLRFSFDSRRKNKKDRLRIAYASGTFGDHPVTHYTKGMFAQHDRRKFTIFLYSYGSHDGGRHRTDLRAVCDVFTDISTFTPLEAARQIHHDEIDILIDLDGYAREGRLDIFALRPSPIQLSYLGYTATTGAEFFDYIIVDETVCPNTASIYYTEKFIYLPNCFTVDSSSARSASNPAMQFVYLPHSPTTNSSSVRIIPEPITRAHYGLPKDAFVFCSFNVASKIDGEIFNLWMNILRQVPGSVLWLYVGNELAEEKLRSHAAERGVDGWRLVLAERVSFDENVRRLALADLALDTVLYNGGATTSNALAAGVPVVNLLGTRFASRMSASMVRAVGAPQLVTHSFEEYEALALDLARNPERLRRVREALRCNRETAPLFDERRFTRNLEKAFMEIWKIFRSEEKPRQIKVVEEE